MPAMIIAGKTRKQWMEEFPLLETLVALRETVWFNPAAEGGSACGLARVGLTAADIQGAADRLHRFAPCIAEVFPETRASGGIIESPLRAVPGMQRVLEQRSGRSMSGRLWAKLDNQLPISGSIKARGGIHEVLQHAETLALRAGLITLADDYRKLAAPAARALFSRHRIAVGSTGNLGLSVGMVGARLGFRVSVHMSADARPWKKDLLRGHGVQVVEHDADFSAAVAAGREQARGDPHTHFVDDENSVSLFLGYAVAARRLAGQLQALDVRMSREAPLFVYLPCGVGGGPGGVTFGLKTVFGDAVHCIFAEPTHAPAMLLGLYTGLHDRVSVQDFGLDNVTAADGLAVGRPSGFVGVRMQGLIDGCCTVDDQRLFRLVALLAQSEGLTVEPSAAAGLAGAFAVAADAEHGERLGLDAATLRRATHLAWLTGGAMVPEAEMRGYVDRGRALP